ncbi:Fasciclin-3, partial [Frankliniella fusca]
LECTNALQALNFHHDGAMVSDRHDLPVDESPLLQAEKQRYSVGEVLRANCTVRGAHPAANITWYLNDVKSSERSAIADLFVKEELNRKEAVRSPTPPQTTLQAQLEMPINIATERGYRCARATADTAGLWRRKAPAETTGAGSATELPSKIALKRLSEGECTLENLVQTTRYYTINSSSERTFPTPLTRAPNPNKLTSGVGFSSVQEDEARRMTVVSSLELEVGADSFQYGKARLQCRGAVWALWERSQQLVLEEERPRLSPVIGSGDSGTGWSRTDTLCVWMALLHALLLAR